MQGTLNESEQKQRSEILVIINMNMAFCHLKRDDPAKAMKHSKDAIELDP